MPGRRNPRDPRPVPISEADFHDMPGAALLAASAGCRVEVRRFGRPIAMLMSFDDFLRLIDPAAWASHGIPSLPDLRVHRED
jgi:hypothetical protein